MAEHQCIVWHQPGARVRCWSEGFICNKTCFTQNDIDTVSALYADQVVVPVPINASLGHIRISAISLAFQLQL